MIIQFILIMILISTVQINILFWLQFQHISISVNFHYVRVNVPLNKLIWWFWQLEHQFSGWVSERFPHHHRHPSVCSRCSRFRTLPHYRFAIDHYNICNLLSQLVADWRAERWMRNMHALTVWSFNSRLN